MPRTITLPELACLRCGYRWFTHKTKGLPVSCPDCKSRRWNEPYVRVPRDKREEENA